jgi:hypothetical protein
MRTALFLVAVMLATADSEAADDRQEDQLEVRLSVYFDLSGEDEPYVVKLGNEPKTFTFRIEEAERLSLKLTPLDGCRVSIEVLRWDSVTTTRPLSWPPFFQPGATFAIRVHFPWHRQEVRGSVAGIGACSRAAPGKLLEPTLETNAAQQ